MHCHQRGEQQMAIETLAGVAQQSAKDDLHIDQHRGDQRQPAQSPAVR